MKAITCTLLSICLVATACKKDKTVATTNTTQTGNLPPTDTTNPADPAAAIDPHVDSLLGTYYGTERYFLLFTKDGDTLNYTDSVYTTTLTVSSVQGNPKVFLITKKFGNNQELTWLKQYVNTTKFQQGPLPPNSGGVAWYFYPQTDSAYYWTGGISGGNGNARQETFTTGSWKR